MQRIRMWVRRYLRNWIPAKIPFKDKEAEEEVLYQLYEREIESLIQFLTAMMAEKVKTTIEDGGYTMRVSVEATGKTIALIKPFPKGKLKSQIFIKVELETKYDNVKICFQTAFLGFKLAFSRPRLELKVAQIEEPREQ